MFSLGTMTPASWVRAETITEIVGELSSGRTSLMLACLRDVTVAGGTAALAELLPKRPQLADRRVEGAAMLRRPIFDG